MASSLEELNIKRKCPSSGSSNQKDREKKMFLEPRDFEKKKS